MVRARVVFDLILDKLKSRQADPSNERWSVPPVFEIESVDAPISRKGVNHFRNNGRTDSLP